VEKAKMGAAAPKPPHAIHPGLRYAQEATAGSGGDPGFFP